MKQWQRLSTIDQFTAHLRAGLLARHWVGTMPGVHRLAAEFGLNSKTVEAALQRLEKEELLVGQGAGRRRRIFLPKGKAGAPALRVAILDHDPLALTEGWMVELQHLLKATGYEAFFTEKCLLELRMDVKRVARLVSKTEADVWIVAAASREILEWFSQLEVPAFALFGRLAGLSLAGTKPDRVPAQAAATHHLVDLGHRRVSFLCRRQNRLPQPARGVRGFLTELEVAGIETGAFNLPDWQESSEGFECALDSLFGGPTPPTALILDEPFLYYAAHHYLAARSLQVPKDVSLICTDSDPGFVWCRPTVAHIDWDYHLVVQRVVSWVNNIARGKDDQRQTLTKAEFVEGGTVGPVAE